MAGQDRKTANAAMAQRLKRDGVIRRTFRNPITGKLQHGRVDTQTAPSGKVGSQIDCYGAIVYNSK